MGPRFCTLSLASLVGKCVAETTVDISNELARQLLDAASDPSIVIGSDGKIVYVNSRVTDVLGYRPAEAIDRDVEFLLPERFREAHPLHRRNFFANPRSRPMGSGLELYALCKDGTEIPVEISLSPVISADRVLAFASLRDVSEQKQLERELREANRAKSRFLAAASHDLRQPLQALTLLNSIAKRASSDNVRSSIIDKQQRSLDSMARLLNALLDISKLEAGVIKPDITDCAVEEIFADLRAEFEEQAQDKGLDLVVDQCRDVARSDPRLLTRILENLISNAIRYTREGLVQLRCQHEALFIRIEVLDTGLGISPNDLDRIFEEFRQLDSGAARPEGLGLGLSIVKRTAELLGCELSVSSTLGQGSVFSVTVPRGSQKRAGTGEHWDRASGTIEGGRILLVDDEPAVAEATRMLLELEGFDVFVAASVDDALKQVGSIPPDLLITDFHLRAGVTGPHVIRAARLQFGDDLPVILVSGDTSDRVKVTDLESTTFLTKPMDAEVLLSTVRRQLQRA
jgi:PAS domain S-box-containing protein